MLTFFMNQKRGGEAQACMRALTHSTPNTHVLVPSWCIKWLETNNERGGGLGKECVCVCLCVCLSSRRPPKMRKSLGTSRKNKKQKTTFIFFLNGKESEKKEEGREGGWGLRKGDLFGPWSHVGGWGCDVRREGAREGKGPVLPIETQQWRTTRGAGFFKSSYWNV